MNNVGMMDSIIENDNEIILDSKILSDPALDIDLKNIEKENDESSALHYEKL
jgi:hypothetical protein